MGGGRDRASGPFDRLVQPLVGPAVPPRALAEASARPASAEALRADYAALRARLAAGIA